MPMDIETLEHLLTTGIPDAEIEIEDLRGDNDHYSVHITSPAFAGKSRLEQHRMVHDAMQGKIGTELHALAIKTSVPHS